MSKSTTDFSSVIRVGLDLVKHVFQVHAIDAAGTVVVAKAVRRGKLLEFFSALPRCVVAMEACSTAHHWGRALNALGFDVRLIPPAHVKPYVRRDKNDAADAAAICEAAGRPGQRFVAVRSIDNQAQLMRHRTREMLVGQRTQLFNALRGHLAEMGVIAPQGPQHAYALKELLTDGADGNGEILVPENVRAALAPLGNVIDELDARIAAIDNELKKQAKADATARRLMSIPGVGPIIASAVLASVQDIGTFDSSARICSLSWLDAASEFQWWQGAARTHHKNGRSLFAQIARLWRLFGSLSPQRTQRRLAPLGRSAADTQIGLVEVQAGRCGARQQTGAHHFCCSDTRRQIRNARDGGLSGARKGEARQRIRDIVARR